MYGILVILIGVLFGYGFSEEDSIWNNKKLKAIIISISTVFCFVGIVLFQIDIR